MKFEVAPFPDRGLGLRAVEDIQEGELVLTERHVGRSLVKLLHRTRDPDIIRYLANRKEGPIPAALKNLVNTEVGEENKSAVLALYDPNPEGPADEKLTRIYIKNEWADGLFLTCSRMNHSCKPAVQMSSDDEVESEVRAMREIKAGEEITVSYLRSSDLGIKEERAEKLWKGWGFQCVCSVCSLSGAARGRNDRLRWNIRRDMQQTKDFTDALFLTGPFRPGQVKSQLSQVLVTAKTNLKILEEEMKGEAEPVVLTILLDLALLSEVARTPLWRTPVPVPDPSSGWEDHLVDDDDIPLEAMSLFYMDRAKEKANQLGVMFKSNCDTREEEIGRTKEAGSGGIPECVIQ